MSTSIGLPADGALFPLLWTSDKQIEVEALIDSFATGHAAMDIGIGLAGFIPIPGAAIAATAAAISAQAPAIYRPMAKQIAAIYGRELDRTSQGEILRGAVGGGLQDAAVFFGVEFFTEIAGELSGEMGLALGLAAIPILGGFVGIALDVKIAWAMTWRVGLMLALYHENGGKWVKDRRHTYDLATAFEKASKAANQPRPRVADFVKGVSEVKEIQDRTVAMMAKMLLDAGVNKDDVARKLHEKGIADDIIARILGRL